MNARGLRDLYAAGITLYRLLTGQMSEDEMCPDIEDAL